MGGEPGSGSALGRRSSGPQALREEEGSRNQEVREAGAQSVVCKRRSWGRSWGQRRCKRCAGVIPREQGSPWQDLSWGERAGMMELQMDRLTPTGASRTDGQEEGEE